MTSTELHKRFTESNLNRTLRLASVCAVMALQYKRLKQGAIYGGS